MLFSIEGLLGLQEVAITSLLQYILFCCNFAISKHAHVHAYAHAISIL